jgi:DNA/RNA endonuclease YhcR with UshA esterase domain
MKLLTKIFFLLLIFACCALCQAKITPAKAKDNIGKQVIVKGKIEQVVKSTAGNYFFNMGGKFPHNKFAAVIFKADAKKFGRLNTYEGKVVEISGRIREYNGKPEIILDSLTQIKIVQKSNEQNN